VESKTNRTYMVQVTEGSGDIVVLNLMVSNPLSILIS
jgi:hypothetical protein